MRDNARRILIGDRSEPMQRWLGMAAARSVPGATDLTYASTGAELLYHLSHGGLFDLVVTHEALPHVAGTQVLAMVRTAGLTTPFVVLDYMPGPKQRNLIARAGRATLVDDPLNSRAVWAAARMYLRPDDSGREDAGWADSEARADSSSSPGFERRELATAAT